MAHTRNLSKSQVSKAGKKLRDPDIEESERLEYLQIYAHWRTAHAKPLLTAFGELQTACQRIDSKAITVTREKRAGSVVDKLRRERSMNLNNMQDIVGCRAIVTTQKDVEKIARLLRKKRHIVLTNNYLKTPKTDGYRGIHLIGKYSTKEFDGLCVEFQLRTNIQHAWATAGEITELFSGQKIKNLYGDEKWKDFYERAADCMAMIDEKYITRDLTAGNIDFDRATRVLRENHSAELKGISRDIKRIARELQIHEKFDVFRRSLKNATELQPGVSKYCVVHANRLDTTEPFVKVHMFETESDARTANFNIEKKITSDVTELVVMLSVNDAKNLEKAYPNYFADSGYFLDWLKVIENI